jgi:hypothetical protein
MGNQGSSQDSTREAIAQIKAGMVGTIKDVHIWTNRPIWPQGLDVVGQTLEKFAAKAKAEDPDMADDLIAEMEEKIANDKKTLDWECWIGPAKYREYYPGIYHAVAWRGWWDFGSGALGDMACHTYNMPFYACDLRNPTSVQAITSGHNFDSFPLRSKIFYEFPATSNRPAVTATWYDGGNKPSQELFEEVGLKESVSDTGALIIGDKGTLFSNGDYCEAWKPVRCEKIEGVTFTPTPRPEGGMDAAQSGELYEAILQNNPSICSGEYSQFGGPLTETILLGNLAVWAASGVDEMGEKIEWDAKNLKITNANSLKTKGTADLIKPVYRPGYKLD